MPARLVALLFCVGTWSLAHAADAPPPPSPVAALEQALAARPDDAVLAFFLGMFRAQAGDREGALDALEQALRHGDGLMPGDGTFESLKDDPRFQRLQARFAKRLTARTDGRVAFTLRDRLLVPEGIAYDPVDRAFYVGSIAKRGIYRLRKDGALQPLSRAEDRVDEVLGLTVDVAARRLYAVSTSALTEAGRKSLRNAVLAYDLASGRLLRRYDVPQARQLNDVAIARDALLVTDSAGSGVWRIDVASGDVKALVPLDSLRGANGIAVMPGGDVAYVAAARRPVRLDVATGAVQPLELPPRENAAVIDGLYVHDGALIGIQNYTTPGRIVRLRLAPDGRSVVAVETMQSHHQRAFDEPTTAAIAPDGLYVLARTYVTRYSERGVVERPDSVKAPLILRVPLG